MIADLADCVILATLSGALFEHCFFKVIKSGETGKQVSLINQSIPVLPPQR